MKIMKKAVTTLGGIFLAALLIAALAPKATHAVVAALVQIVPGDTTQVGQTQSQLVSLMCRKGSSSCYFIDRQGNQSSTAYVVPTGYTLVVTDYQWESNYGAQAGTLNVNWLFNSATSSILARSDAIADTNGTAYAHEHFATGIRVYEGVTIGDFNASQISGNAWVQGYLVPND